MNSYFLSLILSLLHQVSPWKVQDPKISNVILKNIVIEYSKENQVDPRIIFAMILQESRVKANAISPKGARGLLQLMPSTARSLGINIDDPKDNLRGGILYFSQQVKRFNRIDLALAAYNSGPTRVAKLNAIPEIRETKEYVENVIKISKGLHKNSDIFNRTINF